jgi:hypothetical protein
MTMTLKRTYGNEQDMLRRYWKGDVPRLNGVVRPQGSRKVYS